jgi:hypothetical protein
VTSSTCRSGYRTERQLKEADIKAYLKRQVEAAGGKVFPWRSQGVNGVMDRVALWPGGIVDLIELKRPEGGKLSKGQQQLIGWAMASGHRIWIITNKEEVWRYVHHRAPVLPKALPG